MVSAECSPASGVSTVFLTSRGSSHSGTWRVRPSLWLCTSGPSSPTVASGEGQASPKAFSREALLSALSSLAFYQQLEPSLWTALPYGRNALRKMNCRLPQRQSQTHKTTNKIKAPRSHGNIPDTRPQGQCGGISRLSSPRINRETQAWWLKATGVQFLECGLELSKTSGLCQGGGCCQPHFTENKIESRRHCLVFVRLCCSWDRAWKSSFLKARGTFTMPLLYYQRCSHPLHPGQGPRVPHRLIARGLHQLNFQEQVREGNVVQVKCVTSPSCLCQCLGKSAKKMNPRTEPVSRQLSAFAHAVPTAPPMTPACPFPRPRLGRLIPAPCLSLNCRVTASSPSQTCWAHSRLSNRCPPSQCSINIYGMTGRAPSSSRDQRSRVRTTPLCLYEVG